MRQISKQKGILAALVTVGMCFSMQAQAESTHVEDAEYDATSDDGGIERIEDASNFESLSQRIPAAACVFVSSGHADTGAHILHEVLEEFQYDIHVLRDGDAKAGVIGGETNHRVLVRLDILEELWVPFGAAAKQLADGENIEEAMAYVAENNLAILEAAEILFTEVSTEYANPVLVTESEALLLDFSSRLRMLTERIAKESCGVISGNDALGTMEDMNKSVATYEAILNALTNGMPNAGVVAAPTDEIRAVLEEAHFGWAKVRDKLAKVTGKDSIDHDALEALFTLLEEKRANMDKLEHMYGAFAHAHH